MRLLLLALVGFVSAAAAQTPDTLDFRGYFPLAVGNEWEYRVDLTGPFGFPDRTERVRYRVVSTTASPAGDRFAMAMYRLTGSGESRDTVSVRYDDATTSVREVLAGGALGAPTPFFACDLGLAFADPNPDQTLCYRAAGQGEASIPQLTGTPDPVATKRFASFIYVFEAVHGLGFIGGGGGCEPCLPGSSSESWALAFARVGGRSYGTSSVGTEASPVAALPILRVSPNPARGPVAVTVAAAQPVRVVVFDALGREVARLARVEAAGPGVMRLDVSAWPTGVYVVRAVGEAGAVASARLVVAR